MWNESGHAIGHSHAPAGEYLHLLCDEVETLRAQLATQQLENLRLHDVFRQLNTLIAQRGAAALPEIALLIHREIK